MPSWSEGRAAGLPRRPRQAPRIGWRSSPADLLSHCRDRTATLKGKALVVAMTRANCVRLHDALQSAPRLPQIKVVMTGDLGKDPKGVGEAGHPHHQGTARRNQEALGGSRRPAQDRHRLRHVAHGHGYPTACTRLYVDKPMRELDDPGHLAGQPGVSRQATRPHRRLHRDRG